MFIYKKVIRSTKTFWTPFYLSITWKACLVIGNLCIANLGHEAISTSNSVQPLNNRTFHITKSLATVDYSALHCSDKGLIKEFYYFINLQTLIIVWKYTLVNKIQVLFSTECIQDLEK